MTTQLRRFPFALALGLVTSAFALTACQENDIGTGGATGMEGEGSAGVNATGGAGGGGSLVCKDGSHPLVKADGSVGCADGSVPVPDGTSGAGGTGGMPSDPDAPDAGVCVCVERMSEWPAPTLCPDGSVTGHFCEVGADGACAWTVHTCPATPEPQACGSRGLGECAMGQFCFWQLGADCGRADAPGVCADYPTACPLLLQPVCGCDGETYDNLCLAASNGVGADHEGACKPKGDVCGGFAGLACPDGFYCDYAAGQGCEIADGTGICVEQPSACTKEYAPVCGCNGETYGNACAAASEGVSVAHTGACGADGGKCGDTTCTDKQYCDRDVGQCDGAGTCMTRPDACITLYKPVCGCDGMTHGNDCAANSAGTSVAHEGECK